MTTQTNIKAKIDSANQQAINIITSAQPTWVGVQMAKDCLPNFAPNLILHAGPPLDPKNATPFVQTAICGAAVHEGLAKTSDQAWNMVLSGEIKIAPLLDYQSAGGAAYAVAAHTPLQVVEDTVTGKRGTCTFHEGPTTEALRWGVYNANVEKRLTWFDEVLAPVMSKTVAALGGINLRNILARATSMGDENHSRQIASSAILALQLIPAVMDLEIPWELRHQVVKFLSVADRLFLHTFIGGATAVMEAAKGIPYSTVLIAMGGNDYEFGCKFSGMGDQWFTAPCPKCTGMLLNPEWTYDQATQYIGDSCMVETYGFGGPAAAAGPMVVRLTGGDFQEAIRRTEDARRISLGSHEWTPIPWLDFKCLPVGIDMRRVVSTGITPTSHGGIGHVDGGQAGAGSMNVPMECFVKGLTAFADTYAA
jgi:hypothetical protein